MPQVAGRLTHGKYCGAAVFTDHFSELIFLHLITLLLWETMNGKIAYERFAYNHGVEIKIIEEII